MDRARLDHDIPSAIMWAQKVAELARGTPVAADGGGLVIGISSNGIHPGDVHLQ